MLICFLSLHAPLIPYVCVCFQYGYRLPDSDDGMLYYQIYFSMLRSAGLFTYPEVCLRQSGDMMTFNCPDASAVLQQFLADVKAKMPRICGVSLDIGSSEPRFVDRTLLNASQASQAMHSGAIWCRFL